MTGIDTQRTRAHLNAFEFGELFVEDLGWARPASSRYEEAAAGEVRYRRRRVAELHGVVVMEVETEGVPDARARRAIHKQVSALHHENLLIFVDRQRTRSLWYWVKREDGKRHPREHSYFRGQPGDLFLARLSGLFMDLSDFDEEGNVRQGVVGVANRLRESLDVERVTRKFYRDFKEQHDFFLGMIQGIDDERDRRWYASVLLNRLMFIYFLQEKFFLDRGTRRYLQEKLDAAEGKGGNWYYDAFLQDLFFEGFAKPAAQRTERARALLGEIPYLNGGLFLRHPLEQKYAIRIPDGAFARLLQLFEDYTWNLNDTPGGKDDEINPDVLGYIFEKYINQKAFGAYYTRTEITGYLCEQTIHRLILQKVNDGGVPGAAAPRRFDSVSDLLLRLDAPLCRELLESVLPELSVLDPACGSGAFLVAAMKTLIDVYSAVIGRIKFLNDRQLSAWMAKAEADHPSLGYWVKKQIISRNLFGVDLMEEATEIARLRLFLALVSSVERADQLEPLPNIDFNILAGNSLIGLLQVDEQAFNERNAQGNLFFKPYRELVREKDRLVMAYREAAMTQQPDSAALHDLREDIDRHRREANQHLNEMLLDEFSKLGIKFEQATWDEARGEEGKPKKKALTLGAVEELRPFHWAYEFNEVLVARGGFDAIITNPPWDAFKPNAKEFLGEFSDAMSRNMTPKQFDAERDRLFSDLRIRRDWLDYLSRFPHQNLWFRKSDQFRANQTTPVVNGKRANVDLNLFKLFLEQCYHLVRDGGECGIVIPSGIYTDLGSMGLREMLFRKTRIHGLFGFENRRHIFEGVDSRFKFVVLTFEKGGSTRQFPAAFMRHDVAELEEFPQHGALMIPLTMIWRLSPDSLSVTEFKSEVDFHITEKCLAFPPLGERVDESWNVKLGREFHMTDDRKLFRNDGPGRLPLFEGKMIWQFDAWYAPPRYWVDEAEGREALLKREEDTGQVLDYQGYRMAFRDVAASTNERTMISTVLPPSCFTGNTLSMVRTNASSRESLALVALLNSFVVDWMIRQKVTNHCNFFYVYQLPVPRLTRDDPGFEPIVERAARLICTTPEFDGLAAEVGLGSHAEGAIEPDERARLRAELDGMVAHLYGLTEEEFAHVLSTFPLVPQATREAALDAYRALAPHPDDAMVAHLVAGGEGPRVEFKEAAAWNRHTGQKDGNMKLQVARELAGLMNAEGGSVLIGVADDGTVVGIADDLRAADPNKPTRDGYELFLRNALRDALGADVVAGVEVAFHRVGGAEVCRITAPAAERPVYQGGDLHVRTGNQTRKFTAAEAVAYTARRF